MSPRSCLALSLLWLALLVVIGWSVSHRLEMSGDLRKFMPAQNINSRATKHDAARAARPKHQSLCGYADAARAACAIGRATAFDHIAMKARP